MCCILNLFFSAAWNWPPNGCAWSWLGLWFVVVRSRWGTFLKMSAVIIFNQVPTVLKFEKGPEIWKRTWNLKKDLSRITLGLSGYCLASPSGVIGLPWAHEISTPSPSCTLCCTWWNLAFSKTICSSCRIGSWGKISFGRMNGDKRQFLSERFLVAAQDRPLIWLWLMQQSTWTLYPPGQGLTQVRRRINVESWGAKYFFTVDFLVNPLKLCDVNSSNTWVLMSLHTWGKNEFLAKWYSVPGEKVLAFYFFPTCRIGVECLTRGVQSSCWPLHECISNLFAVK
jgi:hypothetical protein